MGLSHNGRGHGVGGVVKVRGGSMKKRSVVFYKIECYIKTGNKRCAERVATDITMDLALSGLVKDHIVISGPCTLKEAKEAGIGIGEHQ